MMTEDRIRQALRDCYDLEIPLNVVELGMVSTIDVTLDADAPGAGIAGVPDRFAIEVTLLAAERQEAYEAQLIAVIHNRLAGLPELSRIAVRVAEGRTWTPGLITAAGRHTLGLDRPQFSILNNRVR